MQMPILGKAEHRARLLQLIDRSQTRNDTELPGRKLHVGSSLTGVEQDGLLDRRTGRHNGHGERGAGEERDVLAGGSQRREGGLVADGEELPGLVDLRRLRPAPGVKNVPNQIVR